MTKKFTSNTPSENDSSHKGKSWYASAHQELLDNFFGDELVNQAANIINTHKTLTPIQVEDINFSYDAVEVLYHTGNIQDFIELSQDLFARYTPKELFNTLGRSKVYYMVIWQWQYFLEIWALDKLKVVINYISENIEFMEWNEKFLYFFWEMKISYLLATWAYQKVLDATEEWIPVQLPDAEQEIFLIDTKIHALYGLKKYEEAADLLQEAFAQFGDYILDHPKLMTSSVKWQKLLLENTWAKLVEQKKYAEAEKIFAKILQKYPDNQKAKQVLTHMSLSVMSKTLKPNAALEDRILQGKILFDLGKYDEARDAFMLVIDYDNQNQEAIDYLYHKLPSPTNTIKI